MCRDLDQVRGDVRRISTRPLVPFDHASLVPRSQLRDRLAAYSISGWGGVFPPRWLSADRERQRAVGWSKPPAAGRGLSPGQGVCQGLV